MRGQLSVEQTRGGQTFYIDQIALVELVSVLESGFGYVKPQVVTALDGLLNNASYVVATRYRHRGMDEISRRSRPLFGLPDRREPRRRGLRVHVDVRQGDAN